MLYRPCHVSETSPGTHTFFPTYTCPVYCWRSVQLLDFGLLSNLIHASQPIRTTFTGQWFASGFLQTPSHNDALAFGCIPPTAGRIRDLHPLDRALARHTKIEGLVNDCHPLLFFTSSISSRDSVKLSANRYNYFFSFIICQTQFTSNFIKRINLTHCLFTNVLYPFLWYISFHVNFYGIRNTAS